MAKGRDERDENEAMQERGASRAVPEPVAAPRSRLSSAVEAPRALPEVIGGGTLGWPVEVEKLEQGVRISVGRHSIDLDGDLLKELRAKLGER